MGTTNSTNTKQLKIQHQRFQTIKVMGSDQIGIQVRSTLDDYNTWKSNLKKANSFNKQNILFPLNHSFEVEGFCSQNTGIVKITYDNYPFVFQQQLTNRSSLNKHLSQQQMWYLMYTLVSTAKDFDCLKRKVGDIRPHNIFVSEAGQIKVAVCLSWPNQYSNLQKTINDKQITYLSPEQMQMCANNKMESILNSVASQSFSIGLTVLHAGLLFNFSSIYNLQRCQINKKLLDQKIKNWMQLQFTDQNNNRTSYSSSLKQIVRNLCMWDPEDRQLSTSIFSMLIPYKQSILNIQPFQLKYKDKRIDQYASGSMQTGYLNPLEKSKGFPIYNYSEISKNVGNTQTPLSLNQNMDWSTRVFVQAPANSNDRISYQNEFFDKYANSANQPHKVGDLSIKLTSTINQIQTSGNKPSPYYHQASYLQPATITIKPFSTINQDFQNHAFRQVNLSALQGQIQNKVQSKDFINYSQPVKQSHVQFNKYHVERVSSNYDPSDFLRKIQQQLQKSKSMFPS